jgi:hypothetical protein
MKWRLGFLLCCAALTAMAGATVATSQEVALVCCEETGACPAAQFCCNPDFLGLEPCSESRPNYCMEVCKRVAGATFTPD